MTLRQKLKKTAEVLLVTFPAWGTVGAVAAGELIDKSRTVEERTITLPGQFPPTYQIRKYDDDRIVARRKGFMEYDIVDKNGDGRADEVVIGVATRGRCFLGIRPPTQDEQDLYANTLYKQL